MTRKSYTKSNYETISREEMSKGVGEFYDIGLPPRLNYQIGDVAMPMRENPARNQQPKRGETRLGERRLKQIQQNHERCGTFHVRPP